MPVLPDLGTPDHGYIFSHATASKQKKKDHIQNTIEDF